MSRYMILKTPAARLVSHLWIALLSALFLVFMFGTFSVMADDLSELVTDYEGEIDATDPVLVNTMKTTMYEYVADDEDIEIVAAWIKNGSQNDSVFLAEVLPIIKDNCTKCHSTSSTMSDAAPDKPLVTYEDLKNYLAPGLPTKPNK